MDHIDSPPIHSSPISKSAMLQKVMRTPTRTLHCCRTATPSQKKRILSTSYRGSFNFRLIISDHFISSNSGSISCNFNITLQPPCKICSGFLEGVLLSSSTFGRHLSASVLMKEEQLWRKMISTRRSFSTWSIILARSAIKEIMGVMLWKNATPFFSEYNIHTSR